MVDAGQDRWMAVQTVPREEFLAECFLARRGYRVWAPWYLKQTRTARSTRSEKAAFFGGYIWVCVRPGQSTERVRTADGVARIVSSGGSPVVFPARIMDRLLALGTHDGYIPPAPAEAAQAKQRFKVGDRVPVLDGPFSTFWGEIAAIDKGGEITLLIKLFGRESPLCFAADSLGDPQSAA